MLELWKLKPLLVKVKVRYREIPDDEIWKIGFCRELLNLRIDDDIQVDGFAADELEEILSFLGVY